MFNHQIKQGITVANEQTGKRKKKPEGFSPDLRGRLRALLRKVEVVALGPAREAEYAYQVPNGQSRRTLCQSTISKNLPLQFGRQTGAYASSVQIPIY